MSFRRRPPELKVQSRAMPAFANNNVVQFHDGYLTEFSTRLPGKSTSTGMQQSHRLALLRSMALPSTSATTQVQQVSTPDPSDMVNSDTVAFDPATEILSSSPDDVLAALANFPMSLAFYKVFGANTEEDSENNSEEDSENNWRDTVANCFLGYLLQKREAGDPSAFNWHMLTPGKVQEIDKHAFRIKLFTAMTEFWSEPIMSDGGDPILVSTYLEEFKEAHSDSVEKIDTWQQTFELLEKQVENGRVQDQDIVMLAWLIAMWMRVPETALGLKVGVNVDAAIGKITQLLQNMTKEGKNFYKFATHTTASLLKLALINMNKLSTTTAVNLLGKIRMAGTNMIQHLVDNVKQMATTLKQSAVIAAPFLAESQIDVIKSSTHWAAPRVPEANVAAVSAVCNIDAAACKPRLQRTRMPASNLMHLYDQLAMRLQ